MKHPRPDSSSGFSGRLVSSLVAGQLPGSSISIVSHSASHFQRMRTISDSFSLQPCSIALLSASQNANSIVGSIGVTYGGFGFHEAIAKLGIERRLYTAGDKKSILDPFSPQKETDVNRVKALQKELHTNFKELVQTRRGDRLTGSARAVFSGDFWTGANALELGLIDGIGDVRSVMRKKYGDKVDLRVVVRRQGLMSMLRRDDMSRGGGFSVTDRLGLNLAEGLLAAAEDRLLWNRYGL